MPFIGGFQYLVITKISELNVCSLYTDMFPIHLSELLEV